QVTISEYNHDTHGNGDERPVSAKSFRYIHVKDAPTLGPVKVARSSMPAWTTVRVSGPPCPRATSSVDYDISPGPQSFSTGGPFVTPGKSWSFYPLIVGRVGAQTIQFECVSDKEAVLAIFPRVTVHISRAAMRVAVKPTTVQRGKAVTLSSPNGCGASAKPTA